MAAKRSPNPDIEVVFQGTGVYPEFVPIRSVADAISAVGRLGVVPGEQVNESPDSPVGIRLLKLKRGSARYLCVTDNSERFRARIQAIGRGIESDNVPDELGGVLRPLNRLCEIAHSLDCTIIIRDPTDRSEVLARIVPETYRNISKQLVIEGSKSFVGNVQRAGGATERRTALRVPFQHMLLYCRVANDALVRQLGGLLYHDVNVTGTARWVRGTWSILEFNILSVDPLAGNRDEFLGSLRDAGGSVWDSIPDPRAFLRQSTGN